MTEIVCAAGDNGECRLRAQGHATGSVEACAGVSAILEALDGYLSYGGGHVKEIRERWIAPGDVGLDVMGDEALRQVWRMAGIGLMRIAKAYPAQVCVSWEGKF